MILFRNFIFYITVIAFTVIFSSIFVIVLFFIHILISQKAAQKTLRFLIVLYGRIIIYGFARILVKIKFIVHASETLQDPPYIYIVNHRSASDAFLMGVLPGEFVQIVNLWPFKIPILGICAKLAGYLSVRSMSFEDFSNECSNLFCQNISIVGFPEGTRSLSSKMGQFHSALFRVAQKNKIPVIPLCILGNQDKPRRKSLLINPGNVEIHQLLPVKYEEFKNFDSFEFKNHVRNLMQIFIDKNENNVK